MTQLRDWRAPSGRAIERAGRLVSDLSVEFPSGTREVVGDLVAIASILGALPELAEAVRKHREIEGV